MTIYMTEAERTEDGARHERHRVSRHL
ncbi:hypothetical protein Hbor_36590 (plasmid) [Halogeometricum borinquense DSM 11551]|uniref:Uncharacterized protein n=1 Tax=Halogeometricum borinquense (strain ATCC 700274 / DSM 11551 / JCM 10706 / KCTC 4070 / PR3) TaxID=469382 RepID=E4NWE5_HALBP|nr:hypothetical protein Hbor_36590 [Halogeometricum borinquense DSM 11551]